MRLAALSDYSVEQVEAWAPTDLSASELAAWGIERASAQTAVAVEGDEVLGFSDLVDGRILDMLYVDPSAARRGIGTALLEHILSLAREACAPEIETHASLTARPVFERHGFTVIEQRAPVVSGIAVTNFRLHLPPPLARPARV